MYVIKIAIKRRNAGDYRHGIAEAGTAR